MPAAPVTPPSHEPEAASTTGPVPVTAAFSSFVESAGKEMLAVSYWFDPPPKRQSSSVRIRFSGRRMGVGARMKPADQFLCEETVEEVSDNSGRISVTARIHDITAGEWITSAAVIETDGVNRGQHRRQSPRHSDIDLYPAVWSWRQWSLHDRGKTSLRTCLAPFIRVPGMIPYVWGPMVMIGIVLGLVLQMVIASRVHLSAGRILGMSAVALTAGAIGAKGWYVVLKRREHRYNGWCIQGFLVAVAAVVPGIATLWSVPIGTFFDVSAPGIFLGAAVGRVGCFLAGCCGGRPTTSRWGVWSSDQRVGRRRIPTQLIEAALALTVSIGSLAVIMSRGPRGGALFAAAVSAYTLVRQGILARRVDPRASRLLSPIVTLAAAAAVVIALAFLVIPAP